MMSCPICNHDIDYVSDEFDVVKVNLYPSGVNMEHTRVGEVQHLWQRDPTGVAEVSIALCEKCSTKLSTKAADIVRSILEEKE